MTNKIQHDIPSQSIRGRRARISAVDPDNSHNVWVAFRGERGTPEPAYFPGNTPLAVGKDVRVTAEPELRRWKVEAEAPTGVTTITLLKVWQLNNTGDTHNHIAVHPVQPWIATIRRSGTARTLEIWNWQTETLVDDIALTASINIWDLKWCPNGDHLAFAQELTPFIKVHPVDPDTGAISAAVSDPASLPSDAGDTVVWHPGHKAVYINNITGGANFVSGWPFITSFGTKFTSPADSVGWGAGTPGAGTWVDVAGYTREAAITEIRGLAITPDGASLVMWAGDGAWGWMLNLQLSLAGAFQERYDSLSKLVFADSSSGPAPWWPDFDDDGSVIIWGNINNAGFDDIRGTLAYACEFTQFDFGHLNGMPYGSVLTGIGIDGPGSTILSASRGPKWRPSTRQVMVPVQSDNEDGGNPVVDDPRLILVDMESARFGSRIHWSPGDVSDWDWTPTANLATGILRTAFSPNGLNFFAGLGGTTSDGLADAIAVFSVS